VTDPVARSIRFDNAAQGEAKEWYRDPTGAFQAGFWSHPGGTLQVTYTEHEFCQILEGSVRLTDAAGHAETYHAGDSFVIPAGFKGSWETLAPLRKFYVIYEPKG
jgi:uncharacterized cupin superfamily protein